MEGFVREGEHLEVDALLYGGAKYNTVKEQSSDKPEICKTKTDNAKQISTYNKYS